LVPNHPLSLETGKLKAKLVEARKILELKGFVEGCFTFQI